MFLQNDEEVKKFVDELLNIGHQKKLLNRLNQIDQEQLQYAKINMKQKMPLELCSKKFQTKNYITKMKSDLAFPSMFDKDAKKIYEYINEDIGSMKKITSSFHKSKLIESKYSSIIKQQKNEKILENQGEQRQLNTPLGEEYLMVKQNINEIQNKTIENQTNNQYIKQQQSNNPHEIQKNIVSPFVSNAINVNDPYANSKNLLSKYSLIRFSEDTRNIAAIVHESKFNAFSQSVAYPTRVMQGNLINPRETTFSRNNPFDVTDIKKYTLGDKFSKTSSQIKKPLQNPFERIPKKRI